MSGCMRRARQRLLVPRLFPVFPPCSSPIHSSISRRFFTSPLSSSGPRTFTDNSEAMLTQQLLDFVKLADEEETPASSIQAELPIHGTVMDVKNGLARVSGLRHATIGSVVAISETEGGQVLCRGLVLFLEKKVAHIAVLNATTQKHAITKNMHVQVAHDQLEIPVSLSTLPGAVIDPLGRSVTVHNAHDPLPSTTNRLKLVWGTQSVPGVMKRSHLASPFETGLLALDCLHPVAHGHRFGLFGPRNSGKTQIALHVIAHQVAQAKNTGHVPPQFVYVCIGKSDAKIHQIRQVLETTGALKYTTIIAASDRESTVGQYIAPFTGCAVAEFFMQSGPSPHCVVIYDDLATHANVVDGLLQSLRLPRGGHSSFSGHAVLLERSAQFKGTNDGPGPSFTSFVLLETPERPFETSSTVQLNVSALVDDFICLDRSMAHFPPINVLQPGRSIRGPPFLSAARWTFLNRLRARLNAAAKVKQDVQVAQKLGLEMEPEDAETLEFLTLVEEFFTREAMLIGQKDTPSSLEIDLGAFFLSIVNVAKLPREPLKLWEFLRQVKTRLAGKEKEDLWLQMTTHDCTKAWSRTLEDNVAKVLEQELEERKQRSNLRSKRGE